jgi:hypothetical protein
VFPVRYGLKFYMFCRLDVKSVAKKRLVKTEDFMCAVVTVIFGVYNSVRVFQLLC